MALGYSLKTVGAALLALWVSLWVGLPMPFWAMTTAFIISNPLSGATRSKAVYRVVGTVVGAAVAVALVPWLVAWPELLSLALALWLGGCLAVSLLDRSPRSYVLMLSGYTATLIGFSAVDRPEAIFDIAAARVTEIGLGIACSTLVHSLLWPRSVAAALQPLLRRWLTDARAWHADTMAQAKMGDDRRQLAIDVVECTLLATHVPFDTSNWREATGAVQALLRRMLLILPVLSGLADRRKALVAADGEWRGLLQESLALRDAQVRALLGECEVLLAHLEDPHRPRPEPLTGRGAITLHADPGFALLSGFSAAVATLTGCALWIGTGWADGGVAVALTGVFCCLFAGMDNPVPTILRFGMAILAGIPLAAIYLFAVLPGADGFAALALLLAIPLVGIGCFSTHPFWGIPAQAATIGFCSALAIQESFSPDFAHFLSSNLAQVVAVILAAGVTAGLRQIGQDVVITRLVRHMRRELADLAAAPTPPDPVAVLSRAIDRLALIAQRLEAGTDPAEKGLVDVRLAMNLASIQQLRASAPAGLGDALAKVLADAAAWFSRETDDPPPAALLDAIDRALALTLVVPPPEATGLATLFQVGPEQGRPALVALRRNLFPDARGFVGVPA
ncbi:MAG: FUSC family protein [Sphingomonadales bacterium]|nr:FUSC family protein [Sphingomonadales bacterium]